MDNSCLKVNNSNMHFLKNYNSLNSAAILSPHKRAVRQTGVKNSKIDGS